MELLLFIIFFFVEMYDYWIVVLWFANIRDLVKLSNLNQTWRKFLLSVPLVQRLIVRNKYELNIVFKKFSQVQYLSSPSVMTISLDVHNKLFQLRSLLFLDLWMTTIELNFKLPPNLISLRVDVDFSNLKELSKNALNLKHLILYCWEESRIIDQIEIIEVFSRFKHLQCLHIYYSFVSSWMAQLHLIKFSFIVVLKYAPISALISEVLYSPISEVFKTSISETMICQHVQN